MDLKYTAARLEDMARSVQASMASIDMAAGTFPQVRSAAAETMRWLREASGLLTKAASNARCMDREVARNDA